MNDEKNLSTIKWRWDQINDSESIDVRSLVSLVYLQNVDYIMLCCRSIQILFFFLLIFEIIRNRAIKRKNLN